MERRFDKSVNRHHVNFTGRDWRRNTVLNRLRNHNGLIIPINIYDHRELHQDLLPPPKPTKDQAEELLYVLGAYDSQCERTDYLDIAINHMKTINPAYAGHLLLQRGYVLLHPFTEIERQMVQQERDNAA